MDQTAATAAGYQDAARMRIRAVLAKALDDITAWKVANLLGAPMLVAYHDGLVDAIWDGIRGLPPEDRILAIIMLLEPEAARLAANPRCEVAP